MRLTINDLRQIFISNIKEEMPVAEKGCPSPKEMLQLFRGKKIKKKKTKILDHITNCSHCVHEFEFILKILRYEKNMNNVAERMIAAKNIKSVNKRLSWRLGPAVAGIFVVCVLIAALIISSAYNGPNYRASALTQIDLIQPQSKEIHKSDLSFEWESIRDTEYYIFELYDESLYQIWRSNKIFETHFVLPKRITTQMQANKTYFWMISSISTNGIKIESRLKEIFLIE